MTISVSALDGSLLVPMTVNDAIPDPSSAACTTPTRTSLWFGGHRLQASVESPEITGGVVSRPAISWRTALNRASASSGDT